MKYVVSGLMAFIMGGVIGAICAYFEVNFWVMISLCAIAGYG